MQRIGGFLFLFVYDMRIQLCVKGVILTFIYIYL